VTIVLTSDPTRPPAHKKLPRMARLSMCARCTNTWLTTLLRHRLQRR
jgi:hypothetical protein